MMTLTVRNKFVFDMKDMQPICLVNLSEITWRSVAKFLNSPINHKWGNIG